jgi:hypothetical protein
MELAAHQAPPLKAENFSVIKGANAPPPTPGGKKFLGKKK